VPDGILINRHLTQMPYNRYNCSRGRGRGPFAYPYAVRRSPTNDNSLSD